MKLKRRKLQNEDDYWRVRNFLRQIFLLNDRHELSWHVARLDYWRWHFIKNLQSCPPIEEVMYLWESPNGRLIAVLHPFGMNEAFLAVHPEYRSAALEDEMIALAEDKYCIRNDQGGRRMFITADDADLIRQQVLEQRGYVRRDQMVHRWWCDLEASVPFFTVDEYLVRSLGNLDELPARSWSSWRSFHPDAPNDEYEGWKWYLNIQAAPLYRRDLDLVAATPINEIAAFCTIWYDDFTRSAVLVLVGTAAEHQRRGLGKAVISEGLRRLRTMGATRVFANAYDPAADALYGSTLGQMKLSHSWLKHF